jgi:hypothetical protein
VSVERVPGYFLHVNISLEKDLGGDVMLMSDE